MRQVRDLVPKPQRISGLADLPGIQKMTAAALELEQMADRLRTLLSHVAKKDADKHFLENKQTDIREALVLLLRQHHGDLCTRWREKIRQTVPEYQSGLHTSRESKEVNRSARPPCQGCTWEGAGVGGAP